MTPSEAQLQRDIYALTRQVAQLRGEVQNARRASGLARSAVDDGSLTVTRDGEATMALGVQYDGTSAPAVLIGPVPPTATRAVASGAVGGAAVQWDGQFVGVLGETDPSIVAPMDFAHVEIHASPDPAFPADTADTIVGTFDTPRGGARFVPLFGSAPRYIRLVVRALSGKRSAASVATQVTPSITEADLGPTARPQSSPRVEASGLSKSLLVRALDPVDEFTALLYEVARDAAFTDIVRTVSTKQTSITLAALPEREDLFVRATASNSLGTALDGPGATFGPVRTLVLGSLDIPDLFEVIGDVSEIANNVLPGLVEGFVTEYAVSDSESSAPTTGWSTTSPTRTPGTYIWSRVVVTRGDGSTSTTSPSVLTGNTGAPGSPGAPGAPGVGITGTVVTYQVGTSGTSAPTGTWSAAPVATTTPGQYLWTRTISTYSDSSTTTGYSIAAHGATGTAGSDGTAGAAGRGISGTVVTYQVAPDATTVPSGTWQPGPQATTPGTFLWTRTVTTYTDGSTTTGYSIAAHGSTGATGSTGPTGAAGVGVSSTAVTYQVHSSGTATPTGTWVAAPQATSPGQFLWTRTVTTYSDASTTTGYAVSAHGATGSTGSTGAAGRGISGTVVTYQVGSDGTTAPTGTWQSTPQATTPGTFLWTRTVTTYSDASTATGYSVAAHGTTGATGVGVTGTTVTYQVGSSGTTAPTGAWSASPVATTAPGQYLWVRTVTTYSNSTSATGYAVSAHGATGAAGVGVSSTAVTYQTATSGTVTPVGTWQSAPVVTSPGQYLWTRTITTYSDASTTTGYAVSAHGQTGAQGTTGNTGAAGVGVSSTAVTYQVGNSGTTAPSGAWSAAPVATTAPGQYLWTRTITTYSDASTSTGYSIAAHGATGSQGTAGSTGATGANGVGVTGTAVTYQVGSSGTSVPAGAWAAGPQATTPGQFLWVRTITSYSDSSTSTAYAVSAHGATGAQGSTGATGPTGAAGVGVSSTAVTYQVAASGTAAPSGTWQPAPQATTPGTFLWTRTITTYSDASTSTGYAVSAHGATGATGTTGSTGAAGVGVSSTAVTYQVASSPTTAPTGTWQASPQATTTGQFLWTRTITTYSDASTSTGYAVSAHGATGPTGSTGSTGAAGVGVTGTVVTYQVGTSGTVAPTGAWSGSPVATTAPGQYLWTRTITSFSDASSATSYAISAHGATGAPGSTGSTGAAGAAGVGVSSTAVTYQVGSSGTTAPVSTWSASPQATAPGQFLWTRTVTTYSDASTTTSYAVSAHGQTGAQGVTGNTGAAGRGITSTAVTYQVHTDPTTAPTGTWQTSPQATSPGQYLWVRTVSTFSDASTTTAYAVSAHGATGATGSTGSAGRGLTSSAVTYQVGASATTAPTGAWSSTVVATTPGTFLWTRTVDTYSDASTNTAYSVAAHGSTGAQGTTGATGAAGVGVSSTAVTYQVGSSGTTVPASTWQASPQATSPGQFLWTRTITTYSDASTVTGYSVSAHGATGAQGTTGAAGRGITGTTVNYQVGTDGTTPPTGTWQTGPQVTSPGQYLWTRTVTTYSDASTVTGYAVSAHGQTGATGSAGGTGAAGRGITGTTVTYQVGTDGTTAPAGTWSASPVATTPGTYLWVRTVTTFSDASTTTAYAVSAHGQTGAQGTTGAQGPTGAQGRGLTGTAITYQVGSSGTAAPTGTWSNTPVATTPGTFLWTRIVDTYSDASTNTSYSVGAHGSTGAQGTTGNTGAAGVGVSSTTVTYQVGSSGTTPPTGTWQTSPQATTTGQFLWTRTIITYSDASTATVYAISAHGATGAQGTAGSTGAAGRGVTSTAVTYQVGTDATTAPAGTWNAAPVATAPGQYLWTRTISTFSDASTTTAYSVSAHGATGAQGGTGAAGRGITSSAITYQVGSSGTVVPAGAWSSTVVATTPGTFLWTRTIDTFSDASTITAYAVSAHGATGSAGGTGPTGVSVLTITPYYARVADTAAAPVKPTTSAPAAPWTLTEPAFAAATVLYRTDRVGFSDGSYAFTDVTRSAVYDAASRPPGGTNLFKTSQTFGGTEYGFIAASGTRSIVATPGPLMLANGTYPNVNAIRLQSTNASVRVFRIKEIREKGWHTVSFWYKRPGTTDTTFVVDVNDGAIVGFTATATWQRGSVSGEVTTLDGTYGFIDIEVALGDGVLIYQPQLETGRVPSAYSMSPEEQQAVVDAVQANVTRKVQWADAAPVNGTTVGAVGDVIYLRGPSNTVSAIYEASGVNTWTLRYVAEAAIGALSVGKITGLQTTLNGLTGDLSKVHIIDPIPTLTGDTGTGTISWTAFTVKYGGITSSVLASSTTNRWVVYRWNNGVPTIEQTDTRPTLNIGDNLLFSNLRGVGVRIFAVVQVDGDLLISGSVVARAIASEAITAEKLAADAITVDLLLAGTTFSDAVTTAGLHIGNGSWTTDQGFDIPDVVSFPVNGLGTASVTAAMTAKSITIENFFTLLGEINNIATGAKLVLSSGVTKPTSPATITSHYPQKVGAYANLVDFTIDPNTGHVYGISNNGNLYQFDSTGAYVKAVNGGLWNASNTAWAIQTDIGPSSVRYLYYMGQMGDGTPVIRRCNMDLTGITTVVTLPAAIDGNFNSTIKPKFAAHHATSQISVICKDTDGNLYHRFFTSNTQVLQARTLLSGPSKTIQWRGGFTRKGPLNNYDDELILFQSAANPQAFNNSAGATAYGTRLTAREFTRGDGAGVAGADFVGISPGTPSGAAFATMDGATGVIRYYTNTVWGHEVSYTWYDGVTPFQETDPSTKQAANLVKFAFAKIVTPAVPANGTSDAPDSARIYAAATGGQQRLQATVPASNPSLVVSAFTAGSPTTPPATNGFGAAAAPATFESVAVATDGSGERMISFKGDGSGRAGPYKWNSLGKVVPDVPWTNIPFATGYSAYGGGYQTPQWKRVGDQVFFRGLVATTAGLGGSASPMFVLPVGSRPAAQVLLGAPMNSKRTTAQPTGTVAAHTHDTTNAGGRVTVTAIGQVYPEGPGAASTWFGLDGLSFWID